MQRIWSIFLVIFLLFPGLGLFAQEERPGGQPVLPPIESDWYDFDESLYSRGDRTFTMTMGVIFPTLFVGETLDPDGHGIRMGGTGSLAFNYFLGPHLFIGGELSGMFAGTRGGNMLYIIPFGLRIGYQFIAGRFEFPLSLMVGAAPQSRRDDGYFGLILKPGASVFWRFNPDWSFGLNSNWWWVPQWPRPVDGVRHTVHGNFLEITLSARYHI